MLCKFKALLLLLFCFFLSLNPAHACSGGGDMVGNVNSEPLLMDTDSDGIPDKKDNCPYIPNPGQADTDIDGRGDICDNCSNVSNPEQTDANGNGIGDACETK